MGNVILLPSHLALLNAWMVNGGIKKSASIAKMSYAHAKEVMKRDDVQQEIRRRQHRMVKRNEDKVEELKNRILEEALWTPPNLAGITTDPEAWLAAHAGQTVYGTINISVTPSIAKHGRKKVMVSYKSPSISEIVALRNQAVELFGLKKQPEVEDEEYLLIQKLNSGRLRMGEKPIDGKREPVSGKP